jgi:hypothetical protein
MPLQVIGVVRRGHPPLSSDVGGDTLGVRLVESGALAAAVTDIDADAQLTDEDATSHLDLLIMLLRGGPVLPLAFGTVSPDEDAVRTEVLDPAAADLELRLDAVDGLVETRLDIFFDESAALRDVLQEDPRLRDLAAQARGEQPGLDTRISLGEAVSSRLTEWRYAQVERLVPALGGAVEDMVELEASEPLQQRWAFLVKTDGLDALDQTVGKLRASLGNGTAVEYVGPLPVYSFLGAPRVEAAQQRSAWGW